MKPSQLVDEVKVEEGNGEMAKPISTWTERHYCTLTTQVQEVLDFVTVLVGNALAYGVYLWLDIGKHHVDPLLYWKLNFLASLVAVLVFASTGLYRETVGILNIEETRRLIKAVSYATVTVMVGSFFIREYSYSRVTAVLALPATLVLLYVQRLMMSSVHGVLHRRGIGVRRCVIYGVEEIGISAARKFFQNPQLGWLPIGFVGDDLVNEGKPFRVTPGPDGRQLQVLGIWENLGEIVQRHEISDVVIAVSAHDKELMEEQILVCQRFGIHCHFILVNTYQLLFSYQLSSLDGIPLLSPKDDDSSSYYYDVLKRVFDGCVSSVLLVVGLPLYLLVTIMIKLDSVGPALFRQMRVGLNGKEFMIYKLRTMYTDAPAYAHTPNSHNDSRITRMGKFLRRTSLDEFPQLLNVLKGDMSLVGPRPEMPFIVSTYTGYQRLRLKAKPGITGLWQISGDRAFQIHENIEYDLYYIANRSISLDLAILFQTIFSVFRGTGAW